MHTGDWLSLLLQAGVRVVYPAACIWFAESIQMRPHILDADGLDNRHTCVGPRHAAPMQNLVLPASLALSAACIKNRKRHVTILPMLLLSCIACYLLMFVSCENVLIPLLASQATAHVHKMSTPRILSQGPLASQLSGRHLYSKSCSEHSSCRFQDNLLF